MLWYWIILPKRVVLFTGNLTSMLQFLNKKAYRFWYAFLFSEFRWLNLALLFRDKNWLVLYRLHNWPADYPDDTDCLRAGPEFHRKPRCSFLRRNTGNYPTDHLPTGRLCFSFFWLWRKPLNRQLLPAQR